MPSVMMYARLSPTCPIATLLSNIIAAVSVLGQENRVSGHVALVERKRGAKWYVKFRLADGRQIQRALGPAWKGRGRPPAGHYTEKLAEAALREILADARRGTLQGVDKTGATFEDAAAEFLRSRRGRAPGR